MKNAAGNKVRIAILFAVGILPYELNGLYNPHLADKPWLFWSLDIFIFIVIPLIIFIYGIQGKIFTARELGFHFDIKTRDRSVPFFVGLVLLPFVFYFGFIGFQYLGYYVVGEGQELTFDFSQTLDAKGLTRLVQVTYFAITAGLVEEFYYRGMFKMLFEDNRLHNIAYVLLSSVIFSSVHWEGGYVKLIISFMLGLMFAISYLKIKNLWPLVFAHFITDFVLFY